LKGLKNWEQTLYDILGNLPIHEASLESAVKGIDEKNHLM
jgi:hypothetical protein